MIININEYSMIVNRSCNDPSDPGYFEPTISKSDNFSDVPLKCHRNYSPNNRRRSTICAEYINEYYVVYVPHLQYCIGYLQSSDYDMASISCVSTEIHSACGVLRHVLRNRRQFDNYLSPIPSWLTATLRNGPVFTLIAAVVAFSVGLCILAFQTAIQQV